MIKRNVTAHAVEARECSSSSTRHVTRVGVTCHSEATRALSRWSACGWLYPLRRNRCYTGTTAAAATTATATVVRACGRLDMPAPPPSDGGGGEAEGEEDEEEAEKNRFDDFFQCSGP